jgi:solute carrier family 35 (GDP-fucose transporter), member C1
MTPTKETAVAREGTKDAEIAAKKLSQKWNVFGVVVLYWVVSISMVYLNKICLNNEQASIKPSAPLFVTWYQCVITCIICTVLGNVGEQARRNGTKSMFTEFRVSKYDWKVGMSVLPLSFVFVGMITFNNLCLQYVQVSFYNVARCLTMVFNVFFQFIFLQKWTNVSTLLTLLVIIVGFVLGIDGEVDFNLLGTISGVMSSVFVSLNAIFNAKVLPKVDNDNNALLYYNNLNACVLFLPLIAVFEVETLMNNLDKLTSLFFWSTMTVTGAFGYAIGLVTVMQIKATDPLTHNISGTAKAAVQSIMAFYIWGNEATTKGVLGILTVLFGSFLYGYVQMRNSDKAQQKPPSIALPQTPPGDAPGGEKA